MSRRRNRDTRHTVRIVCSRAHPEVQVAAYRVESSPKARRDWIDTAASNYTSPALLEPAPGSVDAFDSTKHGGTAWASPGEPLRMLKPRWQCPACGDNVTISARRADLLADAWATAGVSRVDMSELRRTLSDQ